MAFPRSRRRRTAGTLVAAAASALLLPPPGVSLPGPAAPLLPGPRSAMAQQGGGGAGGQEWFVPGGGGGQQQQRPPQQGQQQQRPPQQGAQQRPPQRPAGQQPPAAVIGIVDVPEIQRESTAFNQVREEIERRRQRLNEDLQREQTAWRDAQQQLANQRAAMAPEQLRQRERDLQDRITDSQRIFRERSRAIEVVAQQAVMEIEQALALVIRQVAQGRSVNLVMPRPLVIFNDPAFDLTAEVTQRFNQALRSVTIPPEPAPEGAAPAAAAPQQPAAPRQAAPGGGAGTTQPPRR